jgi:hypothetical protein
MPRAQGPHSRTVSVARGLRLLAHLGEDLDRDVFPVVHDGGLVLPGDTRRPSPKPGKEWSYHEGQAEEGTGGSTARSGQGSTAREGPAGATAPYVRRSGVTADARRDLGELLSAYPQMVLTELPEAAWVSGWIQPLSDLADRALLVTVYPWDRRLRVNAWAWWDAGVWIGPWHTNYPVGSICSYEREDGTWSRNVPLVGLFDLNSVWIARHIHLRYFGRWPGRQVVHTAFERRRELQLDELCGCGSNARYEQCCRHNDLLVDQVASFREFRKRFRVTDMQRRPPTALIEYVTGVRSAPPRLLELGLRDRRLR